MMAGGLGVNVVDSEASFIVLIVATLDKCLLCTGTMLESYTIL